MHYIKEIQKETCDSRKNYTKSSGQSHSLDTHNDSLGKADRHCEGITLTKKIITAVYYCHLST